MDEPQYSPPPNWWWRMKKNKAVLKAGGISVSGFVVGVMTFLVWGKIADDNCHQNELYLLIVPPLIVTGIACLLPAWIIMAPLARTQKYGKRRFFAIIGLALPVAGLIASVCFLGVGPEVFIVSALITLPTIFAIIWLWRMKPVETHL